MIIRIIPIIIPTTPVPAIFKVAKLYMIDNIINMTTAFANAVSPNTLHTKK